MPQFVEICDRVHGIILRFCHNCWLKPTTQRDETEAGFSWGLFGEAMTACSIRSGA